LRYFTYNEQSADEEPILVTKSEKEILDEYWDWWYDKMCEKFGKEHVDANYSSKDCIDDWIVVNWAWEVEDWF